LSRSFSLNVRGITYRGKDSCVSSTAAELSANRVAELLIGHLASALVHRQRAHQEARSAKTALQSVVAAKRLLEGVQLSVGCEALDRRYLGALGLYAEHQARAGGPSVNEHRAASAHAVLTTDVRAGQPNNMAQDVGQQPARLDFNLMKNTVDDERQPRSLARINRHLRRLFYRLMRSEDGADAEPAGEVRPKTGTSVKVARWVEAIRDQLADCVGNFPKLAPQREALRHITHAEVCQRHVK
jgi:hypothetical protein